MLNQRRQLHAWSALIVATLAIESFRTFPVVLLFIVFFLKYMLATLFLGNYLEWPHDGEFIEECAARITSVIHMFLTVPFAALYASGYIDVELWIKTQQFTMGYLLFDAMYLCSVTVMYKSPLDRVMLFHHLSFYLGITILPRKFEWYIAMAYLAEISNPLLYASWYMYKVKLHTTFPRLFRYIAVLLLATFFTFRVINFSYLLWMVVQLSYFGAVLVSVLWVMNIGWFYKLVVKFRSLRSSDAEGCHITKKSE